MNISLNWLTDYVDVTLPAKELGELFTRIGLNCEDIIETPTDIVFDLEVTSNRPDWLGHLGVARELAAATGAEFRPPELPELETSGKVSDLTDVVVEAPDLCPRYTARVIRNVKVGPSPDWMVERLEAVGLRSVNNVVDVTNYVLMEYSQPLHSFDYDKLEEHRIVVRRAKGGETLMSIDETECRLDENMLVIADAEKAVAIAGIMGGLNTEVTDGTTNVLIEAAQFDPLTTRHTSRKLNLMSESNYRFERMIDPVALERASYRACELILKTAGGELADGIVDVWEKPFESWEVSLRPQRCERLLGLTISPEGQVEHLSGLGLSPRMDGDRIVCTIPPFRCDLTREADLVEEVARLEGYDNIPVQHKVTHAVTDEGKVQKARKRVGDLLTAAGFDESLTYTFSDAEEAALFGYKRTIDVDENVRRTNNALRPTVLSGLLRAFKINQDAGNDDVNLYELAGVFPPGGKSDSLPNEYVELGMMTYRDFQELRGAVEVVLRRMASAASLEVKVSDVSGFAPSQAAELLLDGNPVGVLGAIDPKVQKYYALEKQVVAARIRFTDLIDHAEVQKGYQPIPRFPSIHRDLSLVVDENTTWRELEQTIESVDQPLRVGLEYVTIYRGKQIPQGKKSVTVRLEYRSEEGTLRSEQVDNEVQQIVEAAKKKLFAELRAG